MLAVCRVLARFLGSSSRVGVLRGSAMVLSMTLRREDQSPRGSMSSLFIAALRLS